MKVLIKGAAIIDGSLSIHKKGILGRKSPDDRFGLTDSMREGRERTRERERERGREERI